MERKEAIEIVRKLYNESLFMKKDKEAMVTLIPELKEIEDARIRKGIIQYLEQSQFGEEHYQIDDDIVKDYISWLEKQGKQKHNDKVEPKFKIKKGHWYVCIQSFVLNGNTVVIKGQTYKSQEDNTVSGENARLFIDKHDGDASKYFKPWTIQDAKDGDVLEFEDHKRIVVGIVSFVNERTGKVDVSCLLEDNKFKIGNFYALDTIKPHPATKEQRDLLFQGMKEAGYEWDFEKKELKKSEQKYDWSEEDERLQFGKDHFKIRNIENAIGFAYLQDWYQSSIDETTEPVWTDKHLEELYRDFYLIPKKNNND